MQTAIRRVIDRLCKGLALLAGAVLVAIALYAVVDALGRKMFSLPLPGAVDIVSFGLGISIALGLPYCTLRASHVSVPLLTQNMRGIWSVVPMAAMGLSLLFLAVLAMQISIVADRRLIAGDEMWMLKIKTWPIWYLIAGMSIFAGVCQFLLMLDRLLGRPAPQQGEQHYE
jgi:TRAP-type C4-dicarboxylate transport system permease small subunit